MSWAQWAGAVLPATTDVRLNVAYADTGTALTGTMPDIDIELPLISAAAAGLVQSGVQFTASDADTPGNPSYNVTLTRLAPLPGPVSQTPAVQTVIDTINNTVQRKGEANEITSTAGPPEQVTWTQ